MTEYSVYCHMATSIDGKVTGEYLLDSRFAPFDTDWNTIFHKLNSKMKNWIAGRVSFDEIIPKVDLDLSDFIGKTVNRNDYMGDYQNGDKVAIALDPDGKLSWSKSRIGDEYPELKGDHIVTILSESVSDAYLLYLQSIGVSYVFAGQEKPLSMKLALDKLHQLFGITEFLLVGGGIINGSFMQEGLIDTISLIQAPLVESRSDSVSLFQANQSTQPLPQYKVTKNELLPTGALYLIYEKVE